MNLTTIKEIMRRPVGPSICFFCQFVLMPLAAYGIGYGLFPDSHEMALGLFFTGISPGEFILFIYLLMIKLYKCLLIQAVVPVTCGR